MLVLGSGFTFADVRTALYSELESSQNHADKLYQEKILLLLPPRDERESDAVKRLQNRLHKLVITLLRNHGTVVFIANPDSLRQNEETPEAQWYYLLDRVFLKDTLPGTRSMYPTPVKPRFPTTPELEEYLHCAGLNRSETAWKAGVEEPYDEILLRLGNRDDVMLGWIEYAVGGWLVILPGTHRLPQTAVQKLINFSNRISRRMVFKVSYESRARERNEPAAKEEVKKEVIRVEPFLPKKYLFSIILDFEQWALLRPLVVSKDVLSSQQITKLVEAYSCPLEKGVRKGRKYDEIYKRFLQAFRRFLGSKGVTPERICFSDRRGYWRLNRPFVEFVLPQ